MQTLILSSLTCKFTVFCSTLILGFGFVLADPQGSSKSTNQNADAKVNVQSKSSGNKININTAGPEALSTLKGIGKKKAEAIIHYRKENGPFKTVQDLVNVRGIGKKTLSKNIDRLTVSDDSEKEDSNKSPK